MGNRATTYMGLEPGRVHPVETFVHSDSNEHQMAISVAEGNVELIVSGPPAAILQTAVDLYRQVRDACEGFGPVCVFCSKRGVNRGDYAQPYRGDTHAHLGCRSDNARAEALAEIQRLDRIEASA